MYQNASMWQQNPSDQAQYTNYGQEDYYEEQANDDGGANFNSMAYGNGNLADGNFVSSMDFERNESLNVKATPFVPSFEPARTGDQEEEGFLTPPENHGDFGKSTSASKAHQQVSL